MDFSRYRTHKEEYCDHDFLEYQGEHYALIKNPAKHPDKRMNPEGLDGNMKLIYEG